MNDAILTGFSARLSLFLAIGLQNAFVLRPRFAAPVSDVSAVRARPQVPQKVMYPRLSFGAF